MHDDLKQEIKEIVEIVNECPEKFQEKCFEVLLTNYLNREITKHTNEKPPDPTAQNKKALFEGKIHIKVKAFFKKYDLPIEQINKLFLMESNEIEPIYKLKTTKMADSQIQHALLICLKKAIESGEFSFNIEEIRNLCKEKKCYAESNFKKNFKNSTSLFKKIGTNNERTELSDKGLDKLADVIKEII